MRKSERERERGTKLGKRQRGRMGERERDRKRGRGHQTRESERGRMEEGKSI